MFDGLMDDYPSLAYLLSDDLGTDSIYAEDQVVYGPDGPELGPIEGPWENSVDDDEDYYDDYDDDPYMRPKDDEEEEFYVIDPRELSCCYEEWEDYC